MKMFSLVSTATLSMFAMQAPGQQVAYTSFGTSTSLAYLNGAGYYSFGTAAADGRLGWSFVPSITGAVTEVDAVVRNARPTPVDVSIELYADAGNSPGALLGTLSANIPNSANDPVPQTMFLGNGTIQLGAGQTYWAVMSRSTDVPIDWLAAFGTPNGTQATRGSMNSGSDPNVWEVFTTSNPGFPTASLRVIVPGPGAALTLAIAAPLVSLRRRRSVV